MTTAARPDDNAPTVPAVGIPLDRRVRRVRIKAGALVSQDHGIGRWPATKAGDDVDADMEWDAEWTGRFWECRADGFGRRSWLGESGGYGNGSLFVHDFSGVTFTDLDALSA